MTTPPLLCAALEVALNRYLRVEPAALAECARLDGRVIALQTTDLGWRLVLELTATGVRVGDGAELAPDVTVSAATPRLLALALRSAAGESRQGLPEGLRIDGDAELLDRFNRLLHSVGFDIEEPLARLIGDAPAHRVADSLRSLFGWSRSTANRLSLDVAEYLREESGDLAAAAGVEEWAQGVDALREGTDRFEARLARLEKLQEEGAA
jgi:ubiquinone biosynthesis protein UbiJ